MYCTNCGKEIDDKAVICPNCGVPTENFKSVQTAQNLGGQVSEQGKSRFTGGAFANAFIGWISGLVGIISLGLLYPFMLCWKEKWMAKHTYVNGRQLSFDGNGAQLWGRFMLWTILSLVTFGIYYVLCMKVAMAKWVTKHTHFQDSTETKDENGKSLSYFDGKWYQLLGVNLLTGFVTIITLSFGAYWAHCYKEKWLWKHKAIDGLELDFDGKAIQYFGKRVLWTLLTIVTCGIYSFWLKVNSVKWTVSHTLIKGPKQVNAADGATSAVA